MLAASHAQVHGCKPHTTLLALGKDALKIVVGWYPSLLFEEGAFFFSEVVQTLIQGHVRGETS